MIHRMRNSSHNKEEESINKLPDIISKEDTTMHNTQLYNAMRNIQEFFNLIEIISLIRTDLYTPSLKEKKWLQKIGGM